MLPGNLVQAFQMSPILFTVADVVHCKNNTVMLVFRTTIVLNIVTSVYTAVAARAAAGTCRAPVRNINETMNTMPRIVFHTREKPHKDLFVRNSTHTLTKFGAVASWVGEVLRIELKMWNVLTQNW